MSSIRVGITQRIVTIGNERACDALEHTYRDFFSSRAIDFVPIPNHLEDLEQFLKQHRITHLILSGGDTVHADAIRSPRGKEAYPREVTEVALIALALKQKIPILGICRGAQVLNIHFGGNLSMLKKDGHVAAGHDVTITDTELAQKLGTSIVAVNSYHAYGIPSSLLGKSLIPFAVAPDSTVEGFAHQSLPMVGIMWHPERTTPTTTIDNMLIANFIDRKGYWRV